MLYILAVRGHLTPARPLRAHVPGSDLADRGEFVLPLQTVEPRRLYRQIADQIAGLIGNGEFARGSRLPAERELATLLGVSRTSVREALISLEIGGLVEVLAPLSVGAAATRVSRVADVRLRVGRSGWLLLVTEEHDIVSEGLLRVRDRRDIVYRAAADMRHGAAGAPADLPAGPPPGAVTMTLDPDARLLFMYSALTYNAHRIHYDPDYVRDVEGHGRLLVHGPLIATACAEVAQRAVGELRSLEYRLVAPAFVGASVTFHAQRADDGACSVWATQDGQVCARGTARKRRQLLDRR